MICDVILTKSKNKYVARVKEWPEVTVESETRDSAIRQVKKKLFDYLTRQIEVIQIDIPLSANKANPWLEKFGWFGDDPTFDDLQAEIADYRAKLDQGIE